MADNCKPGDTVEKSGIYKVTHDQAHTHDPAKLPVFSAKDSHRVEAVAIQDSYWFAPHNISSKTKILNRN